MRVELEPSYVLHRRAFRNTSLLVELLTQGHGRVGVVGRGLRARTGKRMSVVEPFRPVLASWSGKGELMTLTAVEDRRPMPGLKGKALAAGFYINELIVRLVHRYDPQPEIFDCYDDTMRRLGEGGLEEPVLRVFEKRLLAALGYALLLDYEADSGEGIVPEGLYRYRVEHGPVALESGGEGSGTGDPVIHGRTLLALETERFEESESLKEAKHLMRAILSPYLGDKPLHSRALFRNRSG